MTNTNTIGITAGTQVLTDARVKKGYAWTEQALQSCDYWGKADFVLPGRPAAFIPDLAVKVKVTGRTVRFDAPGLSGVPVVRVRVTFVGDGEPDTSTGGWIKAPGYSAW